MDSQPTLQFDAAYPDHPLSRLTTLFRSILVIPHQIVLGLFGLAAYVVMLIAWFAILITGRFPRGMWDFMLTFVRWSANVSVYNMLMRDEYPPFGEGPYPVTFELAYPEHLSRWKIFLKSIFLIPHVIVLALLGVVAYVLVVIAWFAILITGRYPRGLFDFNLGVLRWAYRVTVYMYLMTDAYPPFTMQPVASPAPGFAARGL